MRTKDKLAHYLQNHPEGVDDGELTRVLHIQNHAHTNSKCRELEQEGYIKRDKSFYPLKNIWLGKNYELNNPESVQGELAIEEYHKTWYWEQNVQDVIVSFLKGEGYIILSEANSKTHERGIDIIAKKNGKELWVTVKGFPRMKNRTKPNAQCVHWFSSALYDMIKYRERNKEIKLAIALPDFERYRNLANEISWFKADAKFNFFWVQQDHIIEHE